MFAFRSGLSVFLVASVIATPGYGQRVSRRPLTPQKLNAELQSLVRRLPIRGNAIQRRPKVEDLRELVRTELDDRDYQFRGFAASVAWRQGNAIIHVDASTMFAKRIGDLFIKPGSAMLVPMSETAAGDMVARTCVEMVGRLRFFPGKTSSHFRFPKHQIVGMAYAGSAASDHLLGTFTFDRYTVIVDGREVFVHEGETDGFQDGPVDALLDVGDVTREAVTGLPRGP